MIDCRCDRPCVLVLILIAAAAVGDAYGALVAWSSAGAPDEQDTDTVVPV